MSFIREWISKTAGEDNATLLRECRNMAVRLVPEWVHFNESPYKASLLTDGLTNMLVKISISDDIGSSVNRQMSSNKLTRMVLVRVFGQGTDEMINRALEDIIWTYAAKSGLAAQIYGKFGNGIVCGFLNGRNLLAEEFTGAFQKYIAKATAHWHSLDIEGLQNDNPEACIELVPTVFSISQNWARLAPFDWTRYPERQRQLQRTGFHTYDIIEIELVWLVKYLSKIDSPLVIAHNDLNMFNCLWDEDTHAISFIDYEYAAINPRGYDIGNHFCEYLGLPVLKPERYPLYDSQREFLSEYLFWIELIEDGVKGDVNAQRERFLKDSACESKIRSLYVEANSYALMSHMMWAIWGLVMAGARANKNCKGQDGWDYFDYACLRFRLYTQHKKCLLSDIEIVLG